MTSTFSLHQLSSKTQHKTAQKVAEKLPTKTVKARKKLTTGEKLRRLARFEWDYDAMKRV